VNFPQCADRAVVDPALDRANVGPIVGGQKMRGDSGSARRLDNQPGLLKPVGDRLMHQDMLALFHRRNGDCRMQVIRRHDFDGVHVLLILQKLPKIRIGSASVELPRISLVGIRGLDNFLCDLPPAGDARRTPSPIGFAKRRGDGCPKFILGPVHVVVTVFDRIADGDNLDLRHGEHAEHFPESLSATADVRQVDLLTGRNKTRSTQNVPRHDGKRRGGRAAGQHELAPGKAEAPGLDRGRACLH
jgi:hypothetical protein